MSETNENTLDGDFKEGLQCWRQFLKDVPEFIAGNPNCQFLGISMESIENIKVTALTPQDVYVNPYELKRVPTNMIVPKQSQWEYDTIHKMTCLGWTFDNDNETTLGFSIHQGEFHWIRDYDKKTRGFIQYNGNQQVNLKVSKDEQSE